MLKSCTCPVKLPVCPTGKTVYCLLCGGFITGASLATPEEKEDSVKENTKPSRFTQLSLFEANPIGEQYG